MTNSDFEGSLEEQTVEISLQKFTTLVEENHEYELLLNDVNPWRKWVHFAHMIDSYRIFPRLFFGMYIVLSFYTGWWYMQLVAPLASQGAFVATIISAGAAWFGLYVKTGWHEKG